MTEFLDIEDADVEGTVALWKACSLTRPWNDPYKDISFARLSDNATVLVHHAEGRVVASVMVGHDGHRGVLYYVAVDPPLWGRGFGKAAVHAAERWLAARGVWKVNLLVRTENAAVERFYETLGYGVSPVIAMSRVISAE